MRNRIVLNNINRIRSRFLLFLPSLVKFLKIIRKIKTANEGSLDKTPIIISNFIYNLLKLDIQQRD